MADASVVRIGGLAPDAPDERLLGVVAGFYADTLATAADARTWLTERAGSEDPYGYVNGNPANMTDPSGLCGFLGDGPCTPGGVAGDINERANQARDAVGICNVRFDEDCRSVAETHPQAAQSTVNVAGGVLNVNPITAPLNLDLQGHGVHVGSPGYNSGQLAMVTVETLLGLGNPVTSGFNAIAADAYTVSVCAGYRRGSCASAIASSAAGHFGGLLSHPAVLDSPRVADFFNALGNLWAAAPADQC